MERSGSASSVVRSLVAAAALQRFGHYGVRSLLIVYLTAHLRLSDHRAGQVYGLFYGSLFMTSLCGGYVGDRSRGYIWAGSIGLSLIVVGQFALAVGHTAVMAIALVLCSVGFGLFDTNMNAVIAKEYQDDERLREAAYTTLYIGINIGAMLGPVVCGYVAVNRTYTDGFMVAGVFTLMGLACYRRNGGGRITGMGRARSKPSVVSADPQGRSTAAAVTGMRPMMFIAAVAILGIIFWAVFDQLGSSVTLLVERFGRRRFGDIEIPAGYVQSINPLLVIILGPISSFFLKRKAVSETRRRNAGTLALGLLLLGSGFGLLSLGSRGVEAMGGRGSVGWIWVLSAIFLATIGELLFAPVALSVVAGSAAPERRAFILGAWSATFGVGAYVSGTMAGSMNSFRSLAAFFALSAGVCFLIGLVLFALLQPIQRFRTVTPGAGVR